MGNGAALSFATTVRNEGGVVAGGEERVEALAADDISFS
jgi:hypothetical protein